MMTLLQINITLSWSEALRQQSWGFWLLLCMGAAMLYIFWERFWALYAAANLPADMLEKQLKPLVRKGDKTAALKLCEGRTPALRLLRLGVEKLGKHFRDIHETMTQESQVTMQELERASGYLLLFSEIIPVVGLGISLFHTQFFTVPFHFAQLLPFWLGWLLGFLGNVGYNLLVMRLRATRATLDKTMHLWLMFLQES